MTLREDVEELEAYAKAGPAVSRATCGRIAEALRLIWAFSPEGHYMIHMYDRYGNETKDHIGGL